MYAWGESKGINAVRCAQGKFSTPEGGPPSVELTMVYMNSKTGSTFGSCVISEEFLSLDALEALNEFLRLAARDYGQVAAGQREVKEEEALELGAQRPGLRMPLGG